MAPPTRTITVPLDMSKAFDTINIHTLTRKLLQTNIPGTIIKFIANYIKGRKANTSSRQFKTGVTQGGVLSPKLFNIYTADIPQPRAPVQLMAHANDITIMLCYLHTAIPMSTRPKVMDLALDPKLTYSTHIYISVQAHKPLHMIKALAATGWGKHKETLMTTYKAVIRPALEYASCILDQH